MQLTYALYMLQLSGCLYTYADTHWLLLIYTHKTPLRKQIYKYELQPQNVLCLTVSHARTDFRKKKLLVLLPQLLGTGERETTGQCNYS